MAVRAPDPSRPRDRRHHELARTMGPTPRLRVTSAPMLVIAIPTPGGPEALTELQVPDPVPGPGEVLVGVRATAVNRADLMQREGNYPPPPGAPVWPGLECSGTVTALGDGVTTIAGDTPVAVGDDVCCLLAGGGYAEQVVVPAGQVMPLPLGPDGAPIDLVQAAALPEVVCTVWSNVFLTALLRPGETLLVHGGSSGIGTMAIQLGVAMKARVAVTAGSASKLAACTQLGATILVNYREQDFVAEVRRETDGHGADVILDNMGAAYLPRNISVLAFNGRVVIIGLQGGTRAEIDLTQLIGKRAAVIGTTLRSRPSEEKSAICDSVVEHVWPLLATGQVRPIVDQVLPLTVVGAQQAHRVLEASTHVGKVVLAREHQPKRMSRRG